MNYKLPEKQKFSVLKHGNKISLFYLKNKNGASAAITNYGGRLVSLLVPDNNKNPIDIILGFNCIDDYFNPDEAYFGATIGRYANRIANGKFSIGNINYQLTTNHLNNTLHGGTEGFESQVFDVVSADDEQITLSLNSTERVGSFPGNLIIKVTYKLTDDNELIINYNAITDKETVINLTNHAYFNLNGEGNETITNHYLQINADTYTPVTNQIIPTGNFEDVSNTPFDFRSFKLIGQDIDQPNNQQLVYGKGFDHNYVLGHQKFNHPILAATIYSPKTGINLEVFTTEPGMQFYSGNFLSGSDKGKSGKSYHSRSAFCLETQHFPDSPNQKNFPSTLLKPNETYKTTTIYKFSVLTETNPN